MRQPPRSAVGEELGTGLETDSAIRVCCPVTCLYGVSDTPETGFRSRLDWGSPSPADEYRRRDFFSHLATAPRYNQPPSDPSPSTSRLKSPVPECARSLDAVKASPIVAVAAPDGRLCLHPFYGGRDS